MLNNGDGNAYPYDGRTRPEWFIVDGPYSRALSAGWSSWKLAWPITKRSLVRLQLPLPTWARPQMRGGSTSYPPGTRAAPHKVPRVASAKGSRAPETEARCCPGSRERSGAFFFPRPRGRCEKIFAPQLPVAEPIAESAKKFFKFRLHARALAPTLPIVEEPRLPRHGKKGDHVEPNWIYTPSRWDFCGLPGPGRLPCRLRGGLRAPNSEELR